MPITSQHKNYIKYAPSWKDARTVIAGQRAMREAKTTYLPRLQDQPDTEYLAMVMRTPFYNASWRTVWGYFGLLFRKPVNLKVPSNVETYLEDVSMQSKPFLDFVKKFTLEWMEVGSCGILVDHPRPPETAVEITLAAAEQEGLRPTMQIYTIENIINWKFKKIKNKNMLARVVLTELAVIDDPNDKWQEKEVQHFRVLELNTDEKGNAVYTVSVFKINERQQEELVEGPFVPLLNGAPLDYIPFYFDPEYEEPPLIDLFDANIIHYQVSADQRHGVHFTALPTPVITGVDNYDDEGNRKDSFYIGSTQAWVFRNPDAKAQFLEFQGQGLDAIEKYIERIERWMIVLGARMLETEKAGVEAFKTQANRQVGETSILAQMAIDISVKIKEALKTFTLWSNNSADSVEFDINRDFMPVNVDAPTLLAWMQTWQNGGMSESEFFELLQRADVIDPEKTLEEHQGEIDAAPPPAPPSNVQPGALGTPTHEQQTANEAAKAKALADAAPKQPPKGK